VNVFSSVPATLFYFSDNETGSLSGAATYADNTIAEGVEISLENTLLKKQTNEDGHYFFPSLMQGNYNVQAVKYGYYDALAQDVVIEAGEQAVVNFMMQELPVVNVVGKITSSADPMEGLQGAIIKINGYMQQDAISGSDGSFSLNDIYGAKQYNLTVEKEGFKKYSAQIQVEDQPLDLGVIILQIMPYSPFFIFTEESDDQLNIYWAGEYFNGFGIEEDFEQDPLANGWEVIINNPSGYDEYATYWSRYTTVDLYGEEIFPFSGNHQMGVMPDWENLQNEWLISPTVNVLGNLSFWMYGYLGSDDGDDYVVAVSEDDGTSWEEIWKASQQKPGFNRYEEPIEIDLEAYQNKLVKFAFIARGPEHGGYGILDLWLIDLVTVGYRSGNLVKYSGTSLNGNNLVTGYSLYRSLTTQPEEEWELLVQNLQDTSFVDSYWSELPFGIYQFAVKAHYSDGQTSNYKVSAPVNNKMELSVPVSIITETGLSANGASLWFINKESDEHNKMVVYSDDTSFEAEKIWRGHYTVFITHPGYHSIIFEDFEVIEGAELNATLCEKITPASNLTGIETAGSVHLEWQKHLAEQEKGWFQGEEVTPFGSVWDELEAVCRFLPEDLVEYSGHKLQSVYFHPANAIGDYKLIIRQGGNLSKPAQPFHVQDIGDLVADQWNEIILDEEVIVDPSQELWVGIKAELYQGNGIGIDQGPAVHEKGNIVRWYWGNFMADLDNNWAIRAVFLENDLQPDNTSRQYQVYRNDQYLAQVDGNTYTYIDQVLQNGEYSYYIIADYFAGQAAPSNTVTINVTGVGISDPAASVVKVFPNPAREILNIELSGDDQYHLEIIDFLGKSHKQAIIQGYSAQVSVFDLPAGFYFLNLRGKDSLVTFKISIIR
jgi:hypothetical protein